MSWTTHEVTNQVPEMGDHDLYASDTVLREAVLREGGPAVDSAVSQYGRDLGRAHIIALAHELDRRPPELQSHDRQGRRVDAVSFSPDWHRFLAMGCAQGLHGPAGVGRAAAFIMHGQVEAGSLCPLTMTSAARPVLARASCFADIRAQLSSLDYDERDIPANEKRGMLVGMGLTEKQGGSDLRRNTTLAAPVAGQDGWYRLLGHKWFFSAPTADAHLVLALLDGEPSCFYVPRWLPDGVRNSVRIVRLKDKLGNRSNASAEVEFEDASARLVGEPGRGIAILAEMAGYTRLDCALGSTALMRAALVHAMHHAQHRVAFGRPLIRQPLMRTVLTDLAIEVEAAVALCMRLARAVQAGPEGDALERALARLATPAAKFWICKRAIPVVAEAMEVLGGNGYVEDFPIARLYREAPVNSLWEGSGNVMCLDVLRGLQRHPDLAQALLDWLDQESAGDTSSIQTVERLKQVLLRPAQELEAAAREVAGALAVLVQAALLRRHAPDAVAQAFCATRLPPGGGTGVAAVHPASAALDSVLERAWETEA